MNPNPLPPILRQKAYRAPSLFQPTNLLREAKRQKALGAGEIPAICLLDPDGDILHNLLATGRATLNPYWACYHTQLYSYQADGIEIGIIGCAVGASFAVLLAEQMFVSGCRLLISITSAGQIVERQPPPYFVCIERALRDEGTSYHYLPPADYAHLAPKLVEFLTECFTQLSLPICWGASWTTDAPYRETAEAIDYARSQEILAVEMEAAALYAFAEAQQKDVVCFAHVTNQMGNIEGDFEKGEDAGSRDALQLIAAIAQRWLAVNAHIPQTDSIEELSTKIF